jgi:hypothetical protein
VALSRRALGSEQIPEILTTRRQQTARERQIAGLFREGRAKEALDMKRADGTAEMAPGGYRETVARIAKLYSKRLRETGEAPTVSAPTNADAHAISEAIRTERRAIGKLGPDRKRIQAIDRDGRTYDMALAVGDRVRLFRSTRARFANGRVANIGRNGSVLEILEISTDAFAVRNLKTGTEGRIAWEELAGRNGKLLLAYGDVLTVNTAQGLTTREHIYALPAGSQAVTGLQAYTAGTRHRQRAYLVTSEVAERGEIRNRRPLNDLREITADDKWANVARNFSNQPEKDIAIGMLERVERIRRGTVRQFPRNLQIAEQRAMRGQAPAQVHEALARRRAELALKPVLQRVAGYARELQTKINRRTTGQSMADEKTAQRRQERSGPRMSI